MAHNTGLRMLRVRVDNIQGILVLLAEQAHRILELDQCLHHIQDALAHIQMRPGNTHIVAAAA